MKDKKYALHYALLYSFLVAIVLLAPLFFYIVYTKNIHAIQNEIFLKEKSLLIIKAMEEFNQNESYFEYPRMHTFESGLYDKNFQPIFSLLNIPIKQFKEGYYIDEENNAFLILQLPTERYFDARYLILTNTISYAAVYEKVAVVLASIFIIVFFLSLFFLSRFAKPFQEVNKKLDSFIKDSMHEINTPLAIININIDLYTRKNPPNKYMQRVKAASKVLSNIYNDMDYLIKNERIDLKPEWINFSDFVLERVEYFTEVGVIKDIALHHEIQKNIEVYINPKHLQRVIDNNISNAIKYSYENSKVFVTLRKTPEAIYLSFLDFGVGIDKVDKIFERYYRENTEKGGFGIGLNIVSSIIKKYGVTLSIASQLKKGSEFTYIFPLTMIRFTHKPL
ncbi:MAG: HAMP domain-containing sensor histidine kinase [Sulfurimonadaceae bacterium]|nr:HAMP domain-containing sensor histidine kinase [Sulfurimonadaceae bacterium]